VEMRGQLRALQWLTLQGAAGTRDALHLAGDIGLTPLEPDWAQAPVARGKEYARKVKELGRVHGLGTPRGQVAASLVEEIAQILDTKSDLDAPMQFVKHALKEFMAQLDQPWGPMVIAEVFLQCRIQEARNKNSDEDVELDTKQRKAKLTRAINSPPSFRAALHDQTLEKTQYGTLLDFKGHVQAGPGTGLERARAVEAQLN
ncbi:unnamed protein product, partial [Prorocentrum cordatum]